MSNFIINKHLKIDVDLEFTISDLSVKCNSKTELFNLLSKEGRILLLPAKDWTLQFTRVLMHGSKQHIKLHKVNSFRFHNTKGYSLKKYWNFLKLKRILMNICLSLNTIQRKNRQWLLNLVNSLVSDVFQNYIDEK